MNRALLKALRSLVAVAALSCANASAQTVNPNWVSFQPSASHDSIGADGAPLVSRYDVEIYRVNAERPAFVVDLGKPAPGADGYVHATIASPLRDASLEAVPLEIRIAAVGPGGVTRSGRSNMFELDNCRLTLSGSAQVGASGGTFAAFVTTSDHCSWSAASATSWLGLAPGASGSGSGPIHVTVSPNTAASSRMGAVRVGPQLLLVFQDSGR